MARSATVVMPGTCGELVQGAIDGQAFSVSCPIDLYSTVTVELGEVSHARREPCLGATKAEAALTLALSAFGECRAARVRISSQIPRSKGMGSSTADVGGVIYASASALDRRIESYEAARLAVQIEPSDGSIFPNLVVFDHRTAGRYEDLGPPPAMEVAVLDFGGEVDTVEFNRLDWAPTLKRTEPIVSEALSLVRRGLRERRVDLIGHGATLSADANQLVLHKARLEDVKDFGRRIHAAGVNVGHSGTVIGVLVDPRIVTAQNAVAQAREEFRDLETSWACRITGGSFRAAAASAGRAT